MSSLRPGLTGSFRAEVTEGDTAVALGSGSVPVLATPRLIAWLEAAAMAALDDALPDGSTSVGTLVEMQHLAATPVGEPVEATATVTSVDGRSIAFDLHASDSRRDIATGRHVRAVVNEERFLAHL